MTATAAATVRPFAPDTARADSEVVAAYLAGDRRAFEMLVDRYQRRLLNFVYRTIGDRERAEGENAGQHVRQPFAGAGIVVGRHG